MFEEGSQILDLVNSEITILEKKLRRLVQDADEKVPGLDDYSPTLEEHLLEL